MSNTLKKTLSLLTTLFVPVALSLLAVRLVLFPWFVEFEYRTPAFPADQYGFTQQDRLKYAQIARRYILSDPAVPSLEDQRFPEGQYVPEFSCQFMQDCSLMYNEREVMHMEDVKKLVGGAMWVLGFSLLALFALGIWANRGGWWEEYKHAIRRGGWLTLPLIVVVILFVVLAFGLIFVFFHQVFFASGTWTFYYSDTLIRLFPERFWRDTFLTVGLLAVGMAGLVVRLAGQKKSEVQSVDTVGKEAI